MSKKPRPSKNQVNPTKPTTLEVFAYTDAEGVERKLNVLAMRSWAEQNLPKVGVDIDIKKVEDMLQSGRVDQDHVKNHTLKGDPKPIIICSNFDEQKSEIVDGNHTYVAMAVAIAKASEMGVDIPDPIRIPAYVFERSSWTRFLL